MLFFVAGFFFSFQFAMTSVCLACFPKIVAYYTLLNKIALYLFLWQFGFHRKKAHDLIHKNRLTKKI